MTLHGIKKLKLKALNDRPVWDLLEAVAVCDTAGSKFNSVWAFIKKMIG